MNRYMQINKKIQELRDNLKMLQQSNDNSAHKSITSFKSQQNSALKNAVDSNLESIEHDLKAKGISASKIITSFRNSQKIEQKLVALEQISELVADAPEEKEGVALPPLDFPHDVRDEMNADLQELKRCFDSACYRSVIVLCGRLLETALHRIHFEVTNQDLLEKSPGMGLGNLIARIEEKGINLDPGLTNQIHLINQVRIYSVHKKQQPFYPTKTQAHAIILYTTDVLKKLFKR